MRRIVFTFLFISFIFLISCKEELMKYDRLDYTVAVFSNEQTTPAGADIEVSLFQGDRRMTKKTDVNGLVTFKDLYEGLTSIDISSAGYTDVSYIVNLQKPASNTTGPTADTTKVTLLTSGATTGGASIKGNVVYANDLTPLLGPTFTALAGLRINYAVSENLIYTLISHNRGDENILFYYFESMSGITITNSSGAYSFIIPAKAAGVSLTLIPDIITKYQLVNPLLDPVLQVFYPDVSKVTLTVVSGQTYTQDFKYTSNYEEGPH